MWITSDVELPDAVLEAQAAGRLVLFVGAGASVDAPSKLPLFDGLARQLAGLAGIPFEDSVGIDFFLGSMPTSFDVHRHTRDLITRASSSPNPTHSALVRLASSTGEMRIVTTNFDTHLSSAAIAKDIDVPDSWIGPALPLGSDFTGIVHLHGSVLREPQQLVLTDGDFGRAYLTNAWATRFLLPMFEKFTVVFIGYSHDDPLMRYLALGLPSGTPRYAFTSTNEASDSKWSRLGVQTIGYPVRDHDHGALVTALQAWDNRVRMGQTEHRAQIGKVVNGGTTLTPVDNDYLIDQLKTAKGSREFVQAVESAEAHFQIEWLHWVEELPQFKNLFTGNEADAFGAILIDWFCQHFIASPRLHGVALQTAQRLGQTFSRDLFRAAGWASESLSKLDADAGARWKAILATSVHGHSAPVNTDTLLSFNPGDRPLPLVVLRAVLRPYLLLRRRLTFGGSKDVADFPDAEVHWDTRAETLTRYVGKAVADSAPGDLMLGSVLEDSLITAYDLLASYHGNREWDPLTFRRSAIEPHEQDQHRDPIDALIDGLRAYGEMALPSTPSLPNRWWSINRPLFRRLALHLITVDTSRTADEKITWLLERATLYGTHTKHETYQLLRNAARDASNEAQTRLLADVLAGPRLPDDLPDGERHTAYAIYNMLVWLVRVAPQWSEARTAFEERQAENPDFAPREHPDLDHWMTSGSRQRSLPMEPEDFISSFGKDPALTVEELVSRDYSKLDFDQPEWDDALALIKRVAESRPDLGEQLYGFLDEQPHLGSKAGDLRRAIVDGWAEATLGATADAAISRVIELVPTPEATRTISHFLLEQIRDQIESYETPAIAAMRLIALDLWRHHSQAFIHAGDAELTSFAPLYLNSWPGDLAQYWLGEIDRRWRNHRDDWSGLNDTERQALTELLEGPRHALDAVQPAFAGQLFFLFAADNAFTSEHVLPLFYDEETAHLAWNAYLYHPRYDDKLLAAGLLGSTIVQWSRLDSVTDSTLRSQFYGVVVSIVSFAGITPEARHTLLLQSVIADDGAHAVDFADEVVRFLGAEEIDGAQVWIHWLREHVTSRLNGIPRTASAEELACWAAVIPHLGEFIPEAIHLFNNRGIGLGERFFHFELPEKILPEYGGLLVPHYAERVRNSSPDNYFIAYRVNDLIETMRKSLGEDAVAPLVAAAVKAGFSGDGVPEE